MEPGLPSIVIPTETKDTMEELRTRKIMKEPEGNLWGRARKGCV